MHIFSSFRRKNTDKLLHGYLRLFTTVVQKNLPSKQESVAQRFTVFNAQNIYRQTLCRPLPIT